MDALLAPVPAVDATATAVWRSTLEDAKSKLAGLAVRRAGAVRFRVTDHEVRTAFTTDATSDLGCGPAVRLVRAHGAAIHRRGRRSPVARGHGALASGGGALPDG